MLPDQPQRLSDQSITNRGLAAATASMFSGAGSGAETKRAIDATPAHFASTARPPDIEPKPESRPLPGHCAGGMEAFESVYLNAEDDFERVPWGFGRPNPHLVSWLNRDACCHVRPGARAAVVGCGLGDDVVELARRGYDVIGFDISPTAIRWAARRHPAIAARLLSADLLAPPGRLLARFDLVIEIDTLHALEPSLQAQAALGVARLVAHRGIAVVMCREKQCWADELAGAKQRPTMGSDEEFGLEMTEPDDGRFDGLDGPPFPLGESELIRMFGEAGMQPLGRIDHFLDADEPPKPRLRAVFTKI